MKVLILSCNTGGGHNSAGKAIMDVLIEKKITCEMVDFLKFGPFHTSEFTSDAYLTITKYIPGFFGALYKFADFMGSRKHVKSPVYGLMLLIGKRVAKYIDEHEFDVVISTHFFPAQAMTYIKKKKNPNLKTIYITTDYTCLPFIPETTSDICVIPHQDLKDEFLNKRVKEESIYPLGIPVEQKYFTKTNQKTAKKQLCLNPHKPMYLIMSGSMGFGNLYELASTLTVKASNSSIVIICGKNEKQKAELSRRYINNENVRIIGFTTEVPLYMDAADVIFTKPGGLTSTEAAIKNVPIIHTEPIPGCETKNALFFSERGMSFYSDNVKDQVSYAIKVATNKDEREKMKEAQRKNINPKTAEDIFKAIKSIY